VAAPASPHTQLTSPARRPAPEDADRYRLHVVATNIADVVTSIGGLIFDRAMAGWDVAVAVEGNADDRAIRILGPQRIVGDVHPVSLASLPQPEPNP
jgi:hypothetical protein